MAMERSPQIFPRSQRMHTRTFHSCHPPHMMKSLPYSQALRICKLCSEEETRSVRLQEMKQFFIEREFPSKLIDTCITNTIANFSKIKLCTRKQPIPLILIYDPRFSTEESKLAENAKWLEHDEIGKKLISEFQPMICYRRPRNLKEMLTHADVYKKKQPTSGNSPCTRNCTNCPRMIRTKTVRSTSNSYNFQIRGNINCSSHYVIYLIECNQCHIQYISQTTNSLAMRMTAHMTDIKKNKTTTVATHFNSHNHHPKENNRFDLHLERLKHQIAPRRGDHIPHGNSDT